MGGEEEAVIYECEFCGHTTVEEMTGRYCYDTAGWAAYYVCPCPNCGTYKWRQRSSGSELGYTPVPGAFVETHHYAAKKTEQTTAEGVVITTIIAQGR